MAKVTVDQEMELALERAVEFAIRKVGMGVVKQTSMFMSNLRSAEDIKKAA